MSEPILNPEEIQDLLKEPQPGGPVGRLWDGECGSYDLLQSGAKADEQLQKVREIHEAAVAPLTEGLRTWSGMAVSVQCGEQSLTPASDLLAALQTDTTILVVWQAAGIETPAALLVDRGFFFRCYAQLLGGIGSEAKPGPLTDLERTFFDRLLGVVLTSLQQAWNRLLPGTFQVRDLLVEQEQVTQLGWNTDVVRAALTVTPEQGEATTLDVLLPREVLGLFSESGPVAATGERTQRDARWIEAVQHVVADTPLPAPLSVELATIRVPMERVLKLQVGDQLPLIMPTDGHPVFIGTHQRFRAAIGTIDPWHAIKITNVGGHHGG